MHKLIKSTVVYTLGELIPRLFSFAFLPIFTTYLSSSDYGIMSYTNSIMLFLYVLACLALNSFLLRKYYEFKTEYDRKRLIGNVSIVIIIFNVLILALAFLIGPQLSKYADLKVDFFPYFSLSILINFLEVFSIVPLVIFRIMEKPTQYVLLNVGKNVLPYLIIYYLLAYHHWGLMSFYYGRLFVNILFLIPLVYITYKHAKFDLSISLIKEGLKFSMPLMPGTIAYLLMSISDRIIMERYISLSMIGIYSIAFTLASGLGMFIQSGYRAFEPEIFKKYGEEDFSNFIEGLHRIFMFIVFSMAIAISIFSKEILQILTNGDFVNGHTLVPILIIGIVLTAENAILGSIAIAEKKTKLSMYSTLVGAMFSIAINIILIPYIGYFGAAIAYVVSFLVMNLITFRGIKNKPNGVNYDLFAFLTYSILSAITTIYITHLPWHMAYIIISKTIIMMFSLILFIKLYKFSFREINNIIIRPISKYIITGIHR